MKKNKFFLLSSLILLASCNIQFEFSVNTSTDTGSNVVLPSTEVSSETSINSVEEQPVGYYVEKNVQHRIKDINDELGWYTLESVGEQKMLVVPVHILGAPEWTSEMLLNIEKAFFGKKEDTNWHSVSSYFYESSYQKLKITGEVTPVLEVNRSLSGIESLSTEASRHISSIFDSSSIVSASKRNEYDKDKNGFIDSVVFIYSNDYNRTGDSAYWAWCYYTQTQADSMSATVNNHMWASYEFINDSYQPTFTSPKGIDCHTYIHETGHLLGLDDYYCYDSDMPWDCAGDRDMQAYNIGDHNIFSKLALGWVNPYVVTDTCSIELRSSALYGDAIIIKDNWNGTIFDNYLIVEFYTPEGLNAQDAKYSFGNYNKMYNYSGLRIYHVDARLVKYNLYSGKATYTNKIGTEFSNQYIYAIGASNSIERQYLNKDMNPNNHIRLLHLLDKGEKNSLVAGTLLGGSSSLKIDASTTLWKSGDTFNPSATFFTKGDNTFNDGTEIGYTIKVGAMAGGKIHVDINKISL